MDQRLFTSPRRACLHESQVDFRRRLSSIWRCREQYDDDQIVDIVLKNFQEIMVKTVRNIKKAEKKVPSNNCS